MCAPRSSKDGGLTYVELRFIVGSHDEPGKSPRETHGALRGIYHEAERGRRMSRKQLLDKMSIYIPQSRLDKRPVERLVALGRKRDRSINYLVVEAILQYLDREEKR
jgi:hypothetical protein